MINPQGKQNTKQSKILKALVAAGCVCMSYTFGAPDKCGPVSLKLYNCIRDIQEGREEDIHNWCLTF